MRSRPIGPIAAVVVATVLLLTGCAANEMGDAQSDLSGTLDGAGTGPSAAGAGAGWVSNRQSGVDFEIASSSSVMSTAMSSNKGVER